MPTTPTGRAWLSTWSRSSADGADQVALTAGRLGELKPEHGWSEEGRSGVLLTKAARASLLAGYERRMLRMTKAALRDFAGTLRRQLYRQAQRLIIGDGDAWRAVDRPLHGVDRDGGLRRA